MFEPMPFGGFEWVEDIGVPALTDEKVDKMQDWSRKIMLLEDEGEEGYIFEVDLEYPQRTA